MTQLDLLASRQGRDRALFLLEQHRASTIAALRSEAWALWHATHQPVCVNQIRPVLALSGFTGDARVLGAVFTKAE